MASPEYRKRMLPLMVAATVPATVVFLGLAVLGWLAPVAATLGGTATILLAAVMLRPYAADLSDVASYARRLGHDGEATAPRPRTDLAADMVDALDQSNRIWRVRVGTLAETVRFHETVFDGLPEPLLVLNDQRRILRANRAASRLFGRPAPGDALTSVLRHPAVLDAVDQVLAGQPGGTAEFTLTGPEPVSFRALVEPLGRDGGATVGGAAAVLSFHDVTALKQMEQMRADFVANASHELRTPLAALLGFIETLRGPARDDAEARERFLAIMQEQAGRMSRLVADLLTLSRIELNERSKPMGRVDVGRVIRRAAAGLQLQAGQRRMPIQLSLADNLPAVDGQEDELEQVFQNLLDNALKYGREGTPVEVTAGLNGKRVLAVTVRDHGEGIAREHLPRLTERFFRVDTARSRRLGGTGLGLAIVKHVVNRHRGQLVIDSTVGEGSRFSVHLPLSEG